MQRFETDTDYLLEVTRQLIACDSPVGYYNRIHALLKMLLADIGYEMQVDNKATAYVVVPGASSEKTVGVNAHLDTIGLVVRGFNDDGTLRVRQLGGINYHSIEGETCHVICRDGSSVNGQIICNHHSIHVFEDAKAMERTEDTMAVSLIADVKSPADARKLGVSEGAVAAIDPHFIAYDNGYIISRFLDDKACVAAQLHTMKWLAQTGTQPAYDTLFAFPIYEEIGHGGAYLPTVVDEYVSLDITLIGPDYASEEHSVGVIVSDIRSPYDWNLSNRLIRCAEKVLEPGRWNQQVAFHFSTDANASYFAGNNLKSGAFGPATLSTHGRERTHMDALVGTENLCRAYVLGYGD